MTAKPHIIIFILAAFLFIWSGTTTLAQDTGPSKKAENQPTKEEGKEGKAKSSDDQPTLDELLRLEEEKKAKEGEAAADDESNILDELDGSSKSPKPDPTQLFLDAVDRMRRSAKRLVTMRDSGLETQRLQEEAILKLDELIAQAKKKKGKPKDKPKPSGECDNPGQQQQPGNKPGSSDNPDKDTRPGFQEQDQAGDLKEAGLEWGHLPPRTRDMLTQGRYDLASSIYRRMTELYYRRLAEESDQ